VTQPGKKNAVLLGEGTLLSITLSVMGSNRRMTHSERTRPRRACECLPLSFDDFCCLWRFSAL